MIYQLLTGSAPFQGGPGQIMYQHLTAEPQPPSLRQGNLPPAIDAVMLKALMKKPEERFPSVLLFSQAFQQAVGHRSVFEVEGEKPTNRNGAIANNESTQPESDTIYATYNKMGSSSTSFMLDESANRNSAPTLNNENSRWKNKRERVSPGSKSNRQGMLMSKAFLIVLLVLLLIGGSIGAFLYRVHPTTQTGSSNGHIDQATLNNNTTNGTATAVSRATNDAQATTQAQNILSTATAQALSRNPYPPSTGTLTLADPLSDNTRGYNWEMGERDQGFCSFTGGSYHSNIPLSGYFHSCLAQSNDFTDFTYEVQMNLLTASAGGIVFRANRVAVHFYYFTVDHNGNYLLKSYYDKNGGSAVLATGSGISLRGNDLIGVVAQGSRISLYVNRQLAGQVNDGTNMHGQLGVVAYEGEAAFSNAKVWTL